MSRRLLSGLRRAVVRAPTSIELTLSAKPELAVLEPVINVADVQLGAFEAPGVWSRLINAQHIEEAELAARLNGKTAGQDAPAWHAGAGGAPMFGVHVCRLSSAYYAPEFGAVITECGDALHSSIAEALYVTPTLAALPNVRVEDGHPKMTISEGTPRLDRAAVFIPWGARFNYGHFLLDGLAALAALEELGFLATHALVTPPLTSWQRDLLRLYLGNEPQVHELTAPLVCVDDLVFASPMDHFLHAPNRLSAEVRAKVLDRITCNDEPKKRRLYLSRRMDAKRHLVNETALELALAERGFEIFFPEEYSVLDQIVHFRNAEIIVAPTGAALANVLFCAPQTKVFEIQPSNFVGIWVRGLCHLLDIDWFGFFAPSPITETDISIEDQPRPGVLFNWKLELEDFLTFLDKNL